MYFKPIATALLALFAAGAAMAIEATQFVPEASTSMTRQEVKAEMAQARQDGSLMTWHEATVFADHPVVAAQRDRAEVRAEARVAARHHTIDPLYVGGSAL